MNYHVNSFQVIPGRSSFIRVLFGVVAMLLFCLSLSGRAEAVNVAHTDQQVPYHLLSTVTVPGTPASSWCYDGGATQDGTYYLADADRQGIDVIKDTAHPSYTGIIGQGDFTGPAGCRSFVYDKQGPDGVVVAEHKLFAGNGDSSVRVYSLSGKFITRIPTGGLARADEGTYDARHGLVIFANSGERDFSPQAAPFLSFISADTYKVVRTLSFPQAASIEQPMWNPYDGKLYLSVTGTTANPGGEVDIIDPVSLHIDTVIPTPDCGDAGLAIGNRDQIAVGCASGPQIVINLDTHALTRIPVTGVDIIASTHKYFFYASYGSATQAPELAITDLQGHLLQTIPISADSHTVTTDPTNGHVIVPLDGGKIAIYALSKDDAS